MKRMLASILAAICLLQIVKKSAATDNTGFVFTEELLQLTRTTVHLSNLAYADNPQGTACDVNYNTIQVWNEEPDQAIVVAVDGYCIAAFRGTVVSSWSDVYQDLQVGNKQVTATKDNVVEYCNAVQGFYEGYNNGFRTELEQALRDCASTCTQSPVDGSVVCPTVVLTGHSQGGSIAAVAALYLTDLYPIVITFGQPPTIDAPCNLVDSENFYRFTNSRVGDRGTTYDPVPYVPYDATQFGHQIMLGEDATGVAYIGKDTATEFWPYDAANGFATHRLDPVDVGYIHRIESLVSTHSGLNSTTPVRSSGFLDGTVCSQDVECDSKNCDNERCIA
jgi:pimeloyl-ACP methyl ester carboxylesterase